jgi:hypothetical protein
MVMVKTLPDAAADAPSAPGAVTVGAGAPPAALVKLTVEPPAASVIVTVMVPPPDQTPPLFSQNWNDDGVADVPPTATRPAELTLVEANAAGAATVATSEASNAALTPTLIAFRVMFKSVDLL